MGMTRSMQRLTHFSPLLLRVAGFSSWCLICDADTRARASSTCANTVCPAKRVGRQKHFSKAVNPGTPENLLGVSSTGIVLRGTLEKYRVASYVAHVVLAHDQDHSVVQC